MVVGPYDKWQTKPKKKGGEKKREREKGKKNVQMVEEVAERKLSKETRRRAGEARGNAAD